jgi:hypothetical protein
VFSCRIIFARREVMKLKRKVVLSHPLFYVGGLVIAAMIVWMQADMRVVISDAATHSLIVAEVSNMDPQNPEEFRRDWSRVMDLEAKNHTVYHVDFREVLNGLTTTAIGGGPYCPAKLQRKRWATDSLMTFAWNQYSHAGVWGYFERNCRYSPEFFSAYGLVHNRWYMLLLKVLSSLGIGGGCAWAMIMLLPYLLCLAWLLIAMAGGRAIHQAQPAAPVVITAPAAHHDPAPVTFDAFGEPVRSTWPIMLVVIATMFTIAARSIAQPTLALLRGRAPPTKETPMRTLSLVLIAMIVPTLVSAAPHTVSVTAGEWAFGRGSMYGYTYDGGQLLCNPTVMSDGSALDLFMRYDLLPNPHLLLNVGGSVGTLVKSAGLHPYVGPSVKLGFSGYGLDLVGMVYSYRTHELLLMEGGVVDLQFTRRSLTIGGGLQPVRYEARAGWTQRVDAHVAYALPRATVTLEGRLEPNHDNRTSANVVVDVPFTYAKK